MSPEDFRKLLENHDWGYGYSDDPGVYRRGKEREDIIRNLAANDPVLKTMLSDYVLTKNAS